MEQITIEEYLNSQKSTLASCGECNLQKVPVLVVWKMSTWWLSNEGIDRLEKLFNSLAVELNAETTEIRLIEVLASADTMDELRRG